jgi:GT2 family glycosyltransferase
MGATPSGGSDGSPPADRSRVSVCIVNWNTRDRLAACLGALREQAEAASAEVIVVDNASADGSAAMVRERFPWVRLIANDENRYYAAANNQGIAASRGRFVLLLNPDVELRPGALETMCRFLKEHEDAAAVGCKLILPDGTTQASCRTFPSPGVLVWEATGLSRIFPRSRRFGAYRMTHWGYDEVAEVDQPMASCLMLRRNALDAVGLFDEQFPMLFNDVDLCLRLKQAGWRIYFTPDASALHHHGSSTRLVRAEMVRESHRGLMRFYRKHYRGRLSPLTYAASALLIWAGGALRHACARAGRALRAREARPALDTEPRVGPS